MLNVKSVACVFREMARVYCAFKERSHLLDYYHCYSFLVDNYLKKQNKKTFFSFNYNRIKNPNPNPNPNPKNFFHPVPVHLPLSLSLQFTPPPTTPLPIMAYLDPIPIPFPSLLLPSHFIFSCPLPILLHFPFQLKFSILFSLFITEAPIFNLFPINLLCCYTYPFQMCLLALRSDSFSRLTVH